MAARPHPNSVEYGNSKTTTLLPSAKCTRPLFQGRTGCGGRPSGWHDIVTCQRLVCLFCVILHCVNLTIWLLYVINLLMLVHVSSLLQAVKPGRHWRQSRPYWQQSWTKRQSTLLPICCRFRQQSTFNKVDRVEFNFVASVYRALGWRKLLFTNSHRACIVAVNAPSSLIRPLAGPCLLLADVAIAKK